MSDGRLGRWIFIRLLGLVFLIAFVSLLVQVRGLVGERGLLPAGEFLAHVRQALGVSAWHRLPTLCWLAHGDAALQSFCAAGAGLALLLIAGVAPRFVLAAAWALYLSLTLVGQTFLSFQWDVLLLETAFTALFYVPGGWYPRLPPSEPRQPRSGVWLLRLLLFKLMFLSGAVKLLSGDEAWWGLTALDFHYFTQPLPTWTAFYAHHLPSYLQRSSVAVMFVIELGLPFLIFLGRLPRLAAAAGITFLMLAIGLTGNYNFFNLLTVALCVPLVDDDLLARLLPRGLRGRLVLPVTIAGVPASPRRRFSTARAIRVALAGALVLVSALTFVREIARTGSSPGLRRLASWGEPVLAYIDPFHTISGYGLFRAMTRTRPEIVIEGSRDGTVWQAYEFRWKPGDLRRRPHFVQPHQPRLDWQMWFAALSPEHQRPWLERLLRRLLEGEPAVLAFFAKNPFPDVPPRWVRLVVYGYEFETLEGHRATGAWWLRTPLGQLTPRPVELGVGIPTAPAEEGRPASSVLRRRGARGRRGGAGTRCVRSRCAGRPLPSD